ncbi:hypothetical protein ABVK25_010992 [Lepraria finkii]|uniref:DUF7924 domain-containing protein n=1 Tax=Lepraria finkii TaxID=1340010 RepID=A0ABR4ASR5_9LECA
MTVAVRALVELFRSVKREKELDREILAFSISQDYRSVRIYSYYPVIEADKTTFYRHPIHKFSFTALDAGINFDLSQSASFSQSMPQSSQQSNANSTLNVDSQSSFLASQEVTPTTSFTQITEPAFKKPKNKRAGRQQR